jgi:hypothetical protein
MPPAQPETRNVNAGFASTPPHAKNKDKASKHCGFAKAFTPKAAPANVRMKSQTKVLSVRAADLLKNNAL